MNGQTNQNEESPPEPISLTQSHSTNEETTGCHPHLTQQPLDPVLSSSASSSRHVVHDVCENLTSNDGPEPPLPLYSRTSNCAERNFIHENMRNARIPDEYYGSDVPLEPCQSGSYVSSIAVNAPLQNQQPQHGPFEVSKTDESATVPLPVSAASQTDTVPLESPSSIENSRMPATNSFTAVAFHPSDPTKFNVDPALLGQVLDFGFEEYISTLAIQRTGGAGVEQAVNWIIDHSNQSDTEDIDLEAMGSSFSRADAASSSSKGALGSIVNVLSAFRNARTHKMIFVANMSLKMGAGKLAAQVGHATLAVYRLAQRSAEGQKALERWRNHGEVKIVVKGQSTEQLLDLFKQAKEEGLFAYLVQDAGHTQVAPGSRTILGIFGPQDAVDKITGQLKLL